MELQDVSEGKPLLFKQPVSGSTVVVECQYVANGTPHTTDLHVTVHGDCSSAKHSLVTFHDIGMNHVSNFNTLFDSEHMEPIRHRFCVFHIDAPGMQEAAADLGNGFPYPSIEMLSDMIPGVFNKFGIKEAVCMGCGLGANVFIRFAMKNPGLVDGLILVNATRSAVGYIPWLGSKISNWTTPLREQLLNYHFSKEEIHKANRDIVESHRRHLLNKMNANNMMLLLREYERRSEIDVHRTFGPVHVVEAEKHSIPCNTLLLVGDMSPFVDDVVELNSRLNPTKTTFLKMADAGGMILEEQLFKVAEAITYFLQGLGHIPSVIMSRLARSRTFSGSSSKSEDVQKQTRSVSGEPVGKTVGDVRAGDAVMTANSKPVIEEVSVDEIIGKSSDKSRLVGEGMC